MPLAAARVGPCSPWIGADEVLALQGLSTLDPELAQVAALASSEWLYRKSAMLFPGSCGPVTVRPVARPLDVDTRSSAFLPMGYVASGIYGRATGVISTYGTLRPPEVDLGPYPVTQVTEVKIDGVVIPPAEYALQDQRKLVRMRIDVSAVPTQRRGWPTSQVLDLPDTEVGTFSVTFMYGTPPPQLGIVAARAAAKYLGDVMLGSPDRLPSRMTSISRQGISVAVLDTMTYLDTGWTGITEVDHFISTYNPTHAVRAPTVWSPDLGRARQIPR